MATNSTMSVSPTIFMNIVVTGIPIITIIANIPAVILFLWMTIKKKNRKNLHLLSIGITDAFVGLFAYLMSETLTQTTRQFSFYDCVFRYYMFSVTFFASLLHILGICIKRLKIFLSDIKVRQNHKVLELTVIVASWVLSAISNTIAFVLWTDERKLTTCRIDELVNGNEYMFFNYTGGLCTIVIILVTACMIALIRVIYSKTTNQLRQPRRSKDLKICVTIGIITLLFFFTTTPLTCVLLFYEHLGQDKRTKRSICVLLSLVNSTLNPSVYLFRIKEFRCGLKELLHCNRNNTVQPAMVVNVLPLNQSAMPGPSNSKSLNHGYCLKPNVCNQQTGQRGKNLEGKVSVCKRSERRM